MGLELFRQCLTATDELHKLIGVPSEWSVK